LRAKSIQLVYFHCKKIADRVFCNSKYALELIGKFNSAHSEKVPWSESVTATPHWPNNRSR